MARTRAQAASQKGRNSPDNEDLLYEAPRGASVRRSPRLKTSQPSPNLPRQLLAKNRSGLSNILAISVSNPLRNDGDFPINLLLKIPRVGLQQTVATLSSTGRGKVIGRTNILSPAWNMLNMPWHGNGPPVEFRDVRDAERPEAAREKSAPYRDTRYETLLNTKGTYMETAEVGIMEENKGLCRILLEGSQGIPQGSVFDDPVFENACKNIQKANEARVIQDISRLVVPSAETLALYNKRLSVLKESVNEGWNNSIPLTGTRPQPDYAVGFRREAFTDEQLAKLSPFIGDFLTGDLSLFMATYYMYFPFMACEVKCGAAALDIADRQNAHSMTLAARGIVELFRLVKREEEVNRQVLSFSISHDHRSVRIYGYYPVIKEKETKYYRHPIHTFDFTALDGREKWTSYQFTRNVYDTWMPKHLKKIRSAIDQLPTKLDFDVPALSDSTGLTPSLQSHHLESSEVDSALSLADENERQREGGQMATPDTSFSKPAKRRKSPVKKP
ncbi:hypothetical protein PG987_004259 [Apiospora arundinis]